MNWATMDRERKHYLFPPFSDAAHSLTADELAIIRNAGFDFVRLTIDPGPFLQFEGAARDRAYDILRQRVRLILDSGLSVIVDFHPVEQDPDYGPRPIVRGIDTPLFESYCDMLARTAQLLSAFDSRRVVLELMNEPQIGGTISANALWQAMEEKAYRAARMAAPHLPLILAGGQTGAYEGLLALDAKPFASDPDTYFTFHYYLPFEFTHQSLPSVPALRTAADIPYPAIARPMSDSVDALAARLSNEPPTQKVADTALGLVKLAEYRASGFSRATIEADFDRVAAWADASGIPHSRIFLGEFGVIRRYGIYDGARPSERAKWLSDVREAAERRGFSWSIWTYRGYGGMAIVKDDSTVEIDPVTLDALGLVKR